MERGQGDCDALRVTKRESFCPSYSVILRHEVPKNPLRSSFFSLKPAIRDSSGDLPPRNDKEGVILSVSEAKGKNPLLSPNRFFN